MPKQFIQRKVTFEEGDYWIVRRTAEARGLGQRGFSAALRQIVREWQELRLLQQHWLRSLAPPGEHGSSPPGGQP
jgi:hypothetical protein